MSQNQELQKIHKLLYSQLKGRAFSLEGTNKELQSYQKAQNIYAKRKFNLSNLNELKKRVSLSDVIFIGDFHSLDQSSRNVTRLLNLLAKSKNEKVSIGVEFVHQDQQAFIDDYLDGLITEKEFLESINYHESWRFPWQHYKIFFEFAIACNWKIYALNSFGNLKTRDQLAAKQISKIANKNEKMIVLFGELHILPNKLPDLVNKKAKGKLRSLIIHQNLDHVFWNLNSKKNYSEGIVKFNSNEFCIISSPPWLKYESMIQWYENISESQDFEINDALKVNNGLRSQESVVDTFNFIVDRVCDSFKLKINIDQKEDFHLYDYNNLSKLLKKIKSKKNVKNIKINQSLIEKGLSMKTLESNHYFCSHFSINKVSYLAGVHICNILSGANNLERKFHQLNNFEKFLFYFRYHFFGYTASKIINPFRKCNLYKDIQQKRKTNSNYEVAFNIIKLKSTKRIPEKLKGLRNARVFEISKVIAYCLADIAFESKVKKGKYNYFPEFLSQDISELESAYKNINGKVVSNSKLINSQKRFF